MKNLKNTKVTFCPGPGAVLPEWFTHQKEYFGRGDADYLKIKKDTISWLKKISGQDEIIPVSGAATTAAIVAFNTFLYKKILIINTGYYSDRWFNYLKKSNLIQSITYISYKEFLKKKKLRKYNWVIFVYVETASCTKFDVGKVKEVCKKNKIKLMMDSTASIGLENGHKLADVIFFSSCKGLFGPTGLGFIGYKKNLHIKQSKDFLLNYKTHKDGMYTLGYNCMASLYTISKKHKFFKNKVFFANKYLSKFKYNKENNPKIGLGLKYKIKNKKQKNSIFYIPRRSPGYDVVFFLGLIKFNISQIKNILNKRVVSEFKL